MGDQPLFHIYMCVVDVLGECRRMSAMPNPIKPPTIAGTIHPTPCSIKGKNAREEVKSVPTNPAADKPSNTPIIKVGIIVPI